MSKQWSLISRRSARQRCGKHMCSQNEMYEDIQAAAAAAAKLLQSCPTLCDPVDGSPPGSPVPGILQARTLEWVAISFSNAWKWRVKVKSISCVHLLVTPWTAAYQAPPSMGFSRQEYWSGLPLPSPEWISIVADKWWAAFDLINAFFPIPSRKEYPEPFIFTRDEQLYSSTILFSYSHRTLFILLHSVIIYPRGPETSSYSTEHHWFTILMISCHQCHQTFMSK